MSTYEDCIKGKFEDIGGIECYVATPTDTFPKDKVILFLTDGFGITLLNNQLIIDDFARNGFKTIAPDILFKDPVPEDFMSGKREFSVPDWSSRHTNEKTRPIIDKVIESLKGEGVKRLAVSGYCFGGRYCFDLAFENIADVVVVSHPSLLKIPEDAEKYACLSKAPLLINSCSVDQAFPLDAQAKADGILGGGKYSPGYKREHWDGCTHGFAVRGDMSDPRVKAGKEGAFKAAVLWFKQYL